MHLAKKFMHYAQNIVHCLSMKPQTLMGGIFAAGIIAVGICIGIATGFSFANPLASAGLGMPANTINASATADTAVSDTTPYIRIDPIAGKTTGDLLIVTGSTNLAAGTTLMVRTTDYGGSTHVLEGTGGVNRFSIPIDTAILKPGTLSLTITEMKENSENGTYRQGTLNATSGFVLNGSWLTTETPVRATVTRYDYLSVNAIGNRTGGDQFLVTGSTSLPIGTEVLWEVTPDVFTTDPNQTTGTFTGMMGNSQVTKGQGNGNRVSFAIDTNALLPGKYNVTVSVPAGDIATGDFRTGTLSGSAVFTLQEELVSGNTGQYIRIDPIADKTTGDLLIVSGATNLPSGTNLMVMTGNYVGDATVQNGTGGVNRFSSLVDTAILKPGQLTVTVSRVTSDPAQSESGTGNVSATAAFTLKGEFLSTETPVQATITKSDYLRINTIGNKRTGDQFLITGTTSLPAGVGLIWQIMPYQGITPESLDLNATGILANNPVTKGNGRENRVSLAVDLGNFEPGEYVLLVGVSKGGPETGDLRIGRPTGSARFTVD